MADITCDVIKDLLPLYVDDVLSPDSRAVVEAHLGTCVDCTEYYHALKEPERGYKQMKNSDDKATLKRIKGTLRKKRVMTALITAVCIAAAFFGLYYGLVIHETYIPYEESGIYVTEDAIRTDRGYYKSTGLYSPDGETLFLFLTTTAQTQARKSPTLTTIPVMGLDKESLTTRIMEDDVPVREVECREIYYVPENTAKQMMRFMTWKREGGTEEEIQQNIEKQVGELKSASTLIWSDSE